MEDLLQGFAQRGDRDALVCADRAYAYRWLLDRIAQWDDRCKMDDIGPGAIVGIRGDHSPDAVALLLALARRGCVIVLLPREAQLGDAALLESAEVEHWFAAADGPTVAGRSGGWTARHELYGVLRAAGHPGLVLFSTGTSGARKAVLHDLERLLEPLRTPGRPYRALAFLLFDHIGGVHTILRILSNGGCLVVPTDRSPDRVLAAVSAHRVELLPTTPSFLNLVLVSGAAARHDLSSLRLVTYGTEPMPQATLTRLRAALPDVDLRQTYGLSELGILRSRSRDSDSLWVRVGGPGFETRVVDGLLEIRAQTSMLGYLDAPSPFTADGWFPTGDLVETDGEYLRILGRASELINVGGSKIHPSLVESVLLELEGVAEATVYGEPNALLGNIVCARIRPVAPGDREELVRRVKQHCRARLARHEVPVRVVVGDEPHHGERHKKLRPRSYAVR